MNIEKRIDELILERRALEINHESIVKENQQINQEFQQKVAKNQTRYAQITGAIIELQKLVNQPQGDNHDDSIPTLNISDRIAHVCAGEQPEGR